MPATRSSASRTSSPASATACKRRELANAATGWTSRLSAFSAKRMIEVEVTNGNMPPGNGLTAKERDQLITALTADYCAKLLESLIPDLSAPQAPSGLNLADAGATPPEPAAAVPAAIDWQAQAASYAATTDDDFDQQALIDDDFR